MLWSQKPFQTDTVHKYTNGFYRQHTPHVDFFLLLEKAVNITSVIIFVLMPLMAWPHLTTYTA